MSQHQITVRLVRLVRLVRCEGFAAVCGHLRVNGQFEHFFLNVGSFRTYIYINTLPNL